MIEKLPGPNLGGFPEKFKEDGIFVHGREIVKVGDYVEAIGDVESGKITKGTKLEVAEIIIEPKGNERGFEKLLKFKGIDGDFSPKKFKKVI